MLRATLLLILLVPSCGETSREQCASGEAVCDGVCVPEGSVCCGHGDGAICPAGYSCGTSAAQPCLKGGTACAAGTCANVFADGHVACCPANAKYYCDGTDACYETWDDAYYGQSCLLPMDRICY